MVARFVFFALTLLISPLASFANTAYRLSDVERHMAFAQGLARRLGVPDIYIGGGSSLAILDHLYFDKALLMRDLDLFLVARAPLKEADIAALARDLAAGGAQIEDFRPKTRVVPGSQGGGLQLFTAGYSFFKVEGEVLLDLSFFHSQADMELNGIFDSDQVMLKFGTDEDVGERLERIRALGYEAARAEGSILDRRQGYRSWVDHRPQIASWEAIKAAPLEIAMRVARVYSRAAAGSLTSGTSHRLRAMVQADRDYKPSKFFKNLFKALADDEAATSLSYMQRFGVFKRVDASLHLQGCGFACASAQATAQMPAGSRVGQPTAEGARNARAMERFKQLLSYFDAPAAAKAWRAFQKHKGQITGLQS